MTLTLSLQDYYELEWKIKCPQSESFLASSQGLALCAHLMLIIVLPIYIFTTYCILYKTPRAMSPVKGVLLTSHLWCCFIDIMVCSLITPYFYLPVLSGFPVGLMTVMGIPTSVQAYIGLVSVMLMGHSLTALFENRSSSIPSNRFRISKKSTRIVYYSINCLVAFVYLIPPFLHIPDQEQARMRLLQQIPCPTEDFFHTNVFVLTVDPFWINYFSISLCFMIFFVVIQIAFHVGCCLYHLFFSTSLAISERTKRYQRHFFLGTVAQAIVPILLFALPGAYCAWVIQSGYYNQELINFLVLLCSFHGFATDIVILLVHHPYRSFINRLMLIVIDEKSDAFHFVSNNGTPEFRWHSV